MNKNGFRFYRNLKMKFPLLILLHAKEVFIHSKLTIFPTYRMVAWFMVVPRRAKNGKRKPAKWANCNEWARMNDWDNDFIIIILLVIRLRSIPYRIWMRSERRHLFIQKHFNFYEMLNQQQFCILCSQYFRDDGDMKLCVHVCACVCVCYSFISLLKKMQMLCGLETNEFRAHRVFNFDNDENKHTREMCMQRIYQTTHAIRKYVRHGWVHIVPTVYSHI